MYKKDLRILIVEDDAIISMYIESILVKNGFLPVGASKSANGALDLIDETGANLLLIDISLEGELNGIDLARIASEKHKISFMFLTGNNDMLESNSLASELNPLAVLSKPTSDRLLIQELLRHFPDQDLAEPTPDKEGRNQ